MITKSVCHVYPNNQKTQKAEKCKLSQKNFWLTKEMSHMQLSVKLRGRKYSIENAKQELHKHSGNLGKRDCFRYNKVMLVLWKKWHLSGFWRTYRISTDRYAGSGLSSQRASHTWYWEDGQVRGLLKLSSFASYKLEPRLKDSCSEFTESQPRPSLIISLSVTIFLKPWMYFYPLLLRPV